MNNMTLVEVSTTPSNSEWTLCHRSFIFIIKNQGLSMVLNFKRLKKKCCFNLVVVAGIHLSTLVSYHLNTNQLRERSWRRRDTESLETLETNGVTSWEATKGLGLLSCLIPCTMIKLSNQASKLLLNFYEIRSWVLLLSHVGALNNVVFPFRGFHELWSLVPLRNCPFQVKPV